MSVPPFILCVMLREYLKNQGNGLVAIRMPWPLKIQLVLLSANCTFDFTALFGGYTQNLHLRLLSQAFPTTKAR